MVSEVECVEVLGRRPAVTVFWVTMQQNLLCGLETEHTESHINQEDISSIFPRHVWETQIPEAKAGSRAAVSGGMCLFLLGQVAMQSCVTFL